MADIAFDDQVDITDKVCPLTFVKAKVAIEELEDGEVLAIRMNDGEPVQNVPRSMKEEGHKILKLEDNEDGDSRAEETFCRPAFGRKHYQVVQGGWNIHSLRQKG